MDDTISQCGTGMESNHSIPGLCRTCKIVRQQTWERETMLGVQSHFFMLWWCSISCGIAAVVYFIGVRTAKNCECEFLKSIHQTHTLPVAASVSLDRTVVWRVSPKSPGSLLFKGTLGQSAHFLWGLKLQPFDEHNE